MFRAPTDWRDMRAMSVVSDKNGYYDSQNIIAVADERGRQVLSAVLHWTNNHEGGAGLALYHCRSIDNGRSWSDLIPIEDPAERICFYWLQGGHAEVGTILRVAWKGINETNRYLSSDRHARCSRSACSEVSVKNIRTQDGWQPHDGYQLLVPGAKPG